MANFKGWMHADGYAGFNELYRQGNVQEMACMAHVRRKFFDIHKSQGSAIAEEALQRIAKLYQIEAEVRGQPPDQRQAVRQKKAVPVFKALEVWLHTQLTRISGKAPLAGAIRYAITRMGCMKPYLDHGFLEQDNNSAERSMRPDVLGRIADHKINRIDELLPWNYTQQS